MGFFAPERWGWDEEHGNVRIHLPVIKGSLCSPASLWRDIPVDSANARLTPPTACADTSAIITTQQRKFILAGTYQTPLCFQGQANPSILEALCNRSSLLLSTPDCKLLRENEMLNVRDLVATISPCFWLWKLRERFNLRSTGANEIYVTHPCGTAHRILGQSLLLCGWCSDASLL